MITTQQDPLINIYFYLLQDHTWDQNADPTNILKYARTHALHKTVRPSGPSTNAQMLAASPSAGAKTDSCVMTNPENASDRMSAVGISRLLVTIVLKL